MEPGKQIPMGRVGENADPERVDASSVHSHARAERSATFERHESADSRRGSASQRRNSGSWRMGSLSFSRRSPSLVFEDMQSEIDATAGDLGDRAVTEGRCSSASNSVRELKSMGSVANAMEMFPNDALVWPNGCFLHEPNSWTFSSPVTPLREEIISPLSTDPVLQHGVEGKSQSDTLNKSEQVSEKDFPNALRYISCVAHLAVFGIMGVFARYLLQKLFGPNVADITSDKTPLYLDLPSNMAGSFLMGWFGVVFKSSISRTSEFVAIGLTTGFLGSLTTFSGWNQKMLELSVEGRWPHAAFGIIIGMMLAVSSIYFGVWTASGLRKLLSRRGLKELKWKVDDYLTHAVALGIMLLILGILWAMSGNFLKTELKGNHSVAQLWLACLVGPVGVWIRWRLARLNGQGLGKAGLWKWIPFGTLLANILAACAMAGLAIMKKVVDTRRCDVIVNGIQFGLLGCLSTVSTFVAEFYSMCQSDHAGRAIAYATLTIVPSFAFGTLIYSVPVWVKGYG